MTMQILLSFAGDDGSGTDALTWGQRHIWALMQRERSSLSIGGAFPLPPGTTARYEEKFFDHFREWPIYWAVVARRQVLIEAALDPATDWDARVS